MPESSKKDYVCPQCKRLVYERTMTICGYCGAALPKDFMLSEEEIAAMKQEKEKNEAERQRLEQEPKSGFRPKKSFKGPGESELTL